MCPVTTPSENYVIVIMCNINCANIAVVSHNTYIPMFHNCCIQVIYMYTYIMSITCAIAVCAQLRLIH